MSKTEIRERLGRFQFKKLKLQSVIFHAKEELETIQAWIELSEEYLATNYGTDPWEEGYDPNLPDYPGEQKGIA